MARKGSSDKIKILPDSKYRNVLIARFINALMKDGKKSLAEKILYNALAEAESVVQLDGLEIFNKAMESVKPSVELCYRRIGGATYPVPVEARSARSTSIAFRWLIGEAKKREKGKNMIKKLAGEFVDAYNGRGGAVRKREENYKMAEANKAFAHFRW